MGAEKWCSYHQRMEPIEEFGIHRGNKDGRQGACMEGKRRYRREQYAQQSKEERDKNNLWDKSTPGVLEAHKAARRALRNGWIKPPKDGLCQGDDCNAPWRDMHHPDHTKKEKVLFLCRQCHKLLHVKEKVAS